MPTSSLLLGLAAAVAVAPPGMGAGEQAADDTPSSAPAAPSQH